jgi:hypothetical protein
MGLSGAGETTAIATMREAGDPQAARPIPVPEPMPEARPSPGPVAQPAAVADRIETVLRANEAVALYFLHGPRPWSV